MRIDIVVGWPIIEWCQCSFAGDHVRDYTVGEQKRLTHLERSYLLLLCVIGYNVVKWSRCELKRDLLYFFNICNNIFS